eukprot:3938394-Rhodomonas_salina.1
MRGSVAHIRTESTTDYRVAMLSKCAVPQPMSVPAIAQQMRTSSCQPQSVPHVTYINTGCRNRIGDSGAAHELVEVQRARPVQIHLFPPKVTSVPTFRQPKPHTCAVCGKKTLWEDLVEGELETIHDVDPVVSDAVHGHRLRDLVEVHHLAKSTNIVKQSVEKGCKIASGSLTADNTGGQSLSAHQVVVVVEADEIRLHDTESILQLNPQRTLLADAARFAGVRRGVVHRLVLARNGAFGVVAHDEVEQEHELRELELRARLQSGIIQK